MNAVFSDHFEAQTLAIRERLSLISEEVERVVPSATACISYKMPAYRARKIFIYFSAFKRHIGIYPPITGPDDLLRDLAPFQGPKGNLAFRHDQPLPLDLIERVIQQLAKQYG